MVHSSAMGTSVSAAERGVMRCGSEPGTTIVDNG
jgi:hypothetical protein